MLVKEGFKSLIFPLYLYEKIKKSFVLPLGQIFLTATSTSIPQG